MQKILMLLIISLLIGCSSDPVRLTQINTEELQQYHYKKLPKKTVSATGFMLLGILPLRMTSREQRIRDAIIERSGGDDMINPLVSSGYRWTPIGGMYRLTVTATPIQIGDLKTMDDTQHR